jgi:hypothetical protein
MSRRRTYTSIVLFLVASGVAGLDEPYDRDICRARVSETQNNYNNLVSRNPDYFFPGSTFDHPIVTLQGCQTLCGSKWGKYPDDGPRLIEWIIPGILLIANVHFAPIGRKRYLMTVHLLGDPVDSLFRLLSTVEVWDECSRKSHEFVQYQEELRKRLIENGEVLKRYNIHPKRIAVVISAAARLVESLDVHKFSKQLFDSLDIRKVSDQAELEIRCHKLHETAIALRHQRMHDIRRTGFAILVYIFQVVAVFVPVVGGSANPSGGKVSPAMMLVWLLPLVLLSNAIGDYGSWELSSNTLNEFLDVLGIDPLKVLDANKTDLETARKPISSPFFSELACSGATLHSRPRGFRKVALIAISILPITIACATAFAVDYTAPTYFSCRATLIWSSLALWFMSSVATMCMRGSLGRHSWLFILLKDIVVATPILVLIWLSSCGYFNSCYCSSGALFRRSHAQVDLNPVSFFRLNNRVIYPATVTAGLGLQMLVPVLVRWVQLRGFKTMWWSDPEELPSVPQRSYTVSTKPKVTVQVDEIELENITERIATWRRSSIGEEQH